MFYTCNYNIRVTHRNGAIKHIFYESDPRRDHQQIVLYSFVAPCAALHLAVKILLKSFCMIKPYIHLSVVFPSECQQDRTLLHNPILLSENILSLT